MTAYKTENDCVRQLLEKKHTYWWDKMAQMSPKLLSSRNFTCLLHQLIKEKKDCIGQLLGKKPHKSHCY